MIDKKKPIPLYYQLQELLMEQINNKIFEVDKPLPSEQELIKTYDVSRTTVRQAIDNLVKEGHLERRRGIGTFVVSEEKKHYWELETLSSFRGAFENKGYSIGTKMLDIKKISCPQHLQQILIDTEVFKIERLRYIENRPAILVTTYVPVSLASDLDSYDFTDISLFDTLQQNYKVKIGYGEKEFKAQLVNPKDAKLLEISEKDPIQLVKTTTYDTNGKVIEYSISRDRGDLSVYKMVLNYQSES